MEKLKLMKNKYLLKVLIAVISLASCKKEYTCTCTTTIGNVVTKTSKFNIDNSTKKNAVANCKSKEGVTSYNGVTTNITCMATN